ncbi:fibronectin type III domain-containing protein [Winogradskyella ouciana]|uniref:T9SS type A sorting domain-containing protein n=1 Tax=Winogradskyella ouciana TaxID=2608631 RepID=A0A7K1G8T7_9FLAO|nr:fibronectin type III domain-containing protein [Winogradskyella ouciana]MTE25696.1 T9SS type A sorting domain-containing protein [Winogradskyella ouciana]
MKTKLLLTKLLFLIMCCAYASNGRYRLILVDDPATTITIGWDQDTGTNPVVHYDTVDHGVDHTLYTFSQTVDRAIVYKDMDNRFVRLSGLTPNTNYYFVINDSEGTSQRFWFRTAPNDNSRLSIIAGGDSRNNRTPRRAANLLVSKLKPHAVLFGGDMTDDSTDLEWKKWFDDWQDTIASDGRMFPIVPTRGNHEDPTDVYNLFDTPNADSYYAITFGNDLFRTYTLNSEISVFGDQLTWLQNDLDSPAGTNATWKAAQYHRPMRPHTANSDKPNNNTLYDAWAELFYDEDVRLVIDCDSHMSKTTWPIRPSSEIGNDEGFVVDHSNGTVYAGEGCWGAPLRDNNDDKSWTRNSGSFNQFKLIFVEPSKIELRTIKVDNAGVVGEVSNTDPFTLPLNLDVFSPPTGAVVTINNSNDVVCPAAGIPCEDGDADTIFDEEDGSCNCTGFSSYDNTVFMAEVSASSDDAEEKVGSGSVSTSSSDLELVFDGDDQIIGVRFNNVEIPESASVIRAYIQFSTDERLSTQPTTNLTIHGELAANSSTFTSATNNISSRTTTSNSTPWSDLEAWGSIDNVGYYQRTPDLSDEMNEIIALPGWVQGNPITFIISGTGERVANAYEDSGPAPKLVVLFDTDCPLGDIQLGATNMCDDTNDTYSQDIVVTYQNAPSTGTLNVNGQAFPITTSPQIVTLTGLDADGFEVDVEAFFSDVPTCKISKNDFYEAPSACSNGGIPDNTPDDNLNLALLPDATVRGSVSGGRGTPDEILYDPSINDYFITSDYNEYGLDFNAVLEASIDPDDGMKWQVNWTNVKYINYITFGGVYTTNNQEQPNTLWRISYRRDGVWITHAEGVGGWIDGGIYEWGGASFNPIEADALRVQLYSDGFNELKSTHLRARGGVSNNVDDSATTPKATLIQYLAPGNSCGVTVPSGSILYCGGDWIYSDGPDETSGSLNTIIADGTYTVDADKEVEVNNLEIYSGATVIVKEGASLMVKGNLTNNGTLQLESISSKYSSLIVDGTSTGNVIYMRHVNNAAGAGTTTAANDLISAPVTGETFGAFRAANPNILSGTIGGNPAFLFGPFDTSTVSFVNYSSADDSSVLAGGRGYRSGSTDGGTYTFNGVVETASVDVPVVAGGASNWNLIGNPYPSYLKVQEFLNNVANSGLIDENAVGIYGYDGTAADGWTIYNLATTNATTVIAPGQGFFIDAEASGNISFTPSMRSKGSDDDFIAGRNASPLTYFKLKATTNNNSYHTDFYFNDNASLGLDPGYDAAIWNETPPSFALYSNLVQENTGVPMALQALNTNDLSDVVIPLGVNANANEDLTFSILESTLSGNVEVYLEDSETNTIVLLNSGDYVFTPSTNISGTGRFYLRFNSNVLGTTDQLLEQLKIYTNSIENTIVISGQLLSETDFKLYDINGRIVSSTELDINTNRQSIDVSKLSSGIYIVELLSTTNEKRIQKLIIH